MMGEMAYLYEVNFAHRENNANFHGHPVPIITEGLVQTTWRKYGFVPADVYEYSVDCEAEIAKIRNLPAIQWSADLDRQMIHHLMQNGSSYLDTAYRLRKKHGVMFTVGTIKGRLYNVLAPKTQLQLLRFGFAQSEISWLHGNSPVKKRAA